MSEPIVLRDANTGKPLKWIWVHVTKTIEEDIPIHMYEEDGIEEAIAAIKAKPKPDLMWMEPTIKWEFTKPTNNERISNE